MDALFEALLDLAKRRGVQPHVVSLSARFPRRPWLASIGGFHVHTRHGSYIFVNPDSPAARRAFVLAHELGHYCLHRGIDQVQYDACGAYHDEREEEANHFAQHLLWLVGRRVKTVA